MENAMVAVMAQKTLEAVTKPVAAGLVQARAGHKGLGCRPCAGRFGPQGPGLPARAGHKGLGYRPVQATRAWAAGLGDLARSRPAWVL